VSSAAVSASAAAAVAVAAGDVVDVAANAADAVAAAAAAASSPAAVDVTSGDAVNIAAAAAAAVDAAALSSAVAVAAGEAVHDAASAAAAAVAAAAVTVVIAAKELQGRDDVTLGCIAEVARGWEGDGGDDTSPRGWQEGEESLELSVAGVGPERHAEVTKPQDAPGHCRTSQGVRGSEDLVGRWVGDGGVVKEGFEEDILWAHVLWSHGAVRDGAAHGTEVVCVAVIESTATGWRPPLKASRREEGQRDPQVVRTATTNSGSHDNLPRVPSRVQHPSDDLGLESIKLGPDVDCCKASIALQEARRRKLRVLDSRNGVVDGAAVRGS
jgi:hypothetical protein